MKLDRKRPAARLCSWLSCGLFALGAAGCGASDTATAPPAEPEALSELDRPCLLLTAELGAELTGQPLFRTMADDLVEGDHVTCERAFGPGGVGTVLRLTVRLPDGIHAADLAYAALCRGDLSEPIAPEQLGAPPPGSCRLEGGGYAVLMLDRVAVIEAEDGAGLVNSELSRAAAEAILAMAPPPLAGLDGG